MVLLPPMPMNVALSVNEAMSEFLPCIAVESKDVPTKPKEDLTAAIHIVSDTRAFAAEA